MLGDSGLTREELDQWEKRGLVDSNFLNTRYTERVKEILDEDSPRAAKLFLKRLRLALRFEDVMAPFWQMVVVIKKYKLEESFEEWIEKQIDRDEAVNKIRFSLPGLIEFSKLPELTKLHNYLYYYRGLERMKKLKWQDNPSFCQFIDALEKSLSKFDEAVKQLLFYWSAFVWSKFSFFMTDEPPAFFIRASSEETHEFALALYKSVSQGERQRIIETIRLWLENKETQRSFISCLFSGLVGLHYLEELGQMRRSQNVWPTKEQLAKIKPNKIEGPEDVQELSKLLGFVQWIDRTCEECEYGKDEAPLEAFSDEIADAFIKTRERLSRAKDGLDSEGLTREDYQKLDEKLDQLKTVIHHLAFASHRCCEKHGKTDPRAEEELLNKINKEMIKWPL